MSAPHDYAILEDDVDHDRFVRFAKKQGFVPHHQAPIAEGNPYFEDVWLTSDRKTAVHYVDDPRYEARFLWVRGGALRQVLHEASKYLAFYDDDELIANAGRVVKLGEAIRAIYRIGIGFPTHRPDAYQVFEAYLQHEHPEMRKAALKAIAYHAWPETEPLLAEAADHDPDPDVREFARPILDGLRKRHDDARQT